MRLPRLRTSIAATLVFSVLAVYACGGDDGSEAPSPSGAVASIGVRDRAGNILATAVAGVANPVSLALSPPLALGPGAESLYVEVSLPAETAARSVAVRLAVPPDIVVADDLTGTTSPIVGGGGLAFQPIASQ